VFDFKSRGFPPVSAAAAILAGSPFRDMQAIRKISAISTRSPAAIVLYNHFCLGIRYGKLMSSCFHIHLIEEIIPNLTTELLMVAMNWVAYPVVEKELRHICDLMSVFCARFVPQDQFEFFAACRRCKIIKIINDFCII
jgi:hypothetical protein